MIAIPVKSSNHSHSKSATMPQDELIRYHWIDGAERLEMYLPGGYHPVMIDDVLHDRYRILDKLGSGGYSTIWLAQDERLKRYVAVKVGISGSSLPGREPAILRDLLSSSDASDATQYVPSILDHFDVQGPNGTHTCYVTAPAQGDLAGAAFCRLFPIQAARALAAKLARAVAFVHSRGFVHGDIHLRNTLVKLSSSFDQLSLDQLREELGDPEKEAISRVDGKPLTPNVPSHAVLSLELGKKAEDFTPADAHDLLLSDFGEAFAPAADQQRLGKDCHTPLTKKAPEALFEPNMPLSYPLDIWGLGTAIWEIICMKFLFSDFEPANEIVAQQIDVLGSQTFPAAWRRQWERPNTKDTEAEADDEMIPRRPTSNREAWPTLEDSFVHCVQKYRRKHEEAGSFGEEETHAILDLIRGMLRFRPEERLTIDEVLRSEWMVKWALPALEGSRP
ncbi:hypothetical protein CP532_3935 [Ophiocordyceps camponoti-leonardi (nom. inval.)]|nr:hypothetical protein CP532_3935 [Ophiocordyceps camponoti-leonardi (nom. inval.)]